MSKERLEKVENILLNRNVYYEETHETEAIDWLLKYANQASKRVQELEAYTQKLQSNIYDTDKILYEVNQDRKRYREGIEKAISEMETLERYGNENAIVAYVVLKEALEESE